MDLPFLLQARLVERFKRFIIKVLFEDGTEQLAHCPNTGSMQGCSLPGQPVYLSRSQNPTRKLDYTWEMIQMPTSLVGVNTASANKIVLEALHNKAIKQLTTYVKFRSEVKTSSKTRIDFLLQNHSGPDCYLEIKSCTWVQDGRAMFPDAKTTRGQRHLQELGALQAKGYNTAILFLIQRQDALSFSPAKDIDPKYTALLKAAQMSGTQILAYDLKLSFDKMVLHQEIPVLL